MFGLARQFQASLASAQEYKRLIAREKTMIDPTSIVLLDEFLLRCAGPLVETRSHFADLFNDHGDDIVATIEGRTNFESIARFDLTYDHLAPDLQAFVRKRYEYVGYISERDEVDQLIRQMRTCPQMTHVFIDYRNDMQNQLPQHRPYYGIYLESIIEEMNGALVDRPAFEY